MVREGIVLGCRVPAGIRSFTHHIASQLEVSLETTCDAYDHAIGTVPGQCKDNQHYFTSYASKALTGVQRQWRRNFWHWYLPQVHILLGWC